MQTATTSTDLFNQIATEKAAEFLSVSPRLLEKLRREGGGPSFVRISQRCIRYRLKDLIDWQESLLRENNATGSSAA